MAEEGAGFDEPDPFAEPNPLKENVPLYAVYGATGFTVLLFLGTLIWLQFPSEAIEAELRAMRPNLTKKVPSLRRSARGASPLGPRDTIGTSRAGESGPHDRWGSQSRKSFF